MRARMHVNQAAVLRGIMRGTSHRSGQRGGREACVLVLQVLDEPMEVLTVDSKAGQPREVKLIGPGQVTMRAPTTQAVLSLPTVAPEKAILLATAPPDADARAVALIGQDTSLLNKKEPSFKCNKDDPSGASLPWVADPLRCYLGHRCAGRVPHMVAPSPCSLLCCGLDN
jgi:hypothetical protein